MVHSCFTCPWLAFPPGSFCIAVSFNRERVDQLSMLVFAGVIRRDSSTANSRRLCWPLDTDMPLLIVRAVRVLCVVELLAVIVELPFCRENFPTLAMMFENGLCSKGFATFQRHIGL